MPESMGLSVDVLRVELGRVWQILEDEDVTDIHLSAAAAFAVVEGRAGRHLEAIGEGFDLDAVVSSLCGILDEDAGDGTVEGVVPGLELRVQVVEPPLAEATQVVLRRTGKLFTGKDLIEAGMLKEEQFEWMVGLMKSRQPLVIAAPTGAGKTTLARAVLLELVAQDELYRLVTVEERSRELQVPGVNVASLCTAPGRRETTLDLIAMALRMNPDALVVGEIRRGEEAAAWVASVTSGHACSAVTVHADCAEDGSFRDAERVVLERLMDLARQGGEAIDPERLRRMVGGIVLLEKHPVMGRRVRFLISVQPDGKSSTI